MAFCDTSISSSLDAGKSKQFAVHNTFYLYVETFVYHVLNLDKINKFYKVRPLIKVGDTSNSSSTGF